MTTHVIICAAGQGKRMGLGENKQFLKLCNKPLLIHTLEAFEKMTSIEAITLVVGPNEEDVVNNLLQQNGITKVYQIVQGGKERQESVYRGLKAIEPLKPAVVLIHDGARPFIGEEEVDAVIEAAHTHQAAIVAVPVKDTIKSVHNNMIEKTVSRAKLWSAQTPQAFTYDLIMTAHERGLERHIVATDDASLVEQMGVPVHIVSGKANNIKLTTPEDIAFAEYMIQRSQPK